MYIIVQHLVHQILLLKMRQDLHMTGSIGDIHSYGVVNKRGKAMKGHIIHSLTRHIQVGVVKHSLAFVRLSSLVQRLVQLHYLKLASELAGLVT